MRQDRKKCQAGGSESAAEWPRRPSHVSFPRFSHPPPHYPSPSAPRFPGSTAAMAGGRPAPYMRLDTYSPLVPYAAVPSGNATVRMVSPFASNYRYPVRQEWAGHHHAVTGFAGGNGGGDGGLRETESITTSIPANIAHSAPAITTRITSTAITDTFTITITITICNSTTTTTTATTTFTEATDAQTPLAPKTHAGKATQRIDADFFHTTAATTITTTTTTITTTTTTTIIITTTTTEDASSTIGK
ncbi:hypothetical protein E2C01_024954 [Portunus trituberculatus]|uniref:Uncharacterized protein n=1 Tax=Portunus trituberculatus TaxID=210409 RepID=A0A5B7EDU0_PORTR|nr:hypothetical protein [Portunus trituberculatus]